MNFKLRNICIQGTAIKVVNGICCCNQYCDDNKQLLSRNAKKNRKPPNLTKRKTFGETVAS